MLKVLLKLDKQKKAGQNFYLFSYHRHSIKNDDILKAESQNPDSLRTEEFEYGIFSNIFNKNYPKPKHFRYRVIR